MLIAGCARRGEIGGGVQHRSGRGGAIEVRRRERHIEIFRLVRELRKYERWVIYIVRARRRF